MAGGVRRTQMLKLLPFHFLVLPAKSYRAPASMIQHLPAQLWSQGIPYSTPKSLELCLSHCHSTVHAEVCAWIYGRHSAQPRCSFQAPSSSFPSQTSHLILGLPLSHDFPLPHLLNAASLPRFYIKCPFRGLAQTPDSISLSPFLGHFFCINCLVWLFDYSLSLQVDCEVPEDTQQVSSAYSCVFSTLHREVQCRLSH